jgi:hypothetical protein
MPPHDGEAVKAQALSIAVRSTIKLKARNDQIRRGRPFPTARRSS